MAHMNQCAWIPSRVGSNVTSSSLGPSNPSNYNKKKLWNKVGSSPPQLDVFFQRIMCSEKRDDLVQFFTSWGSDVELMEVLGLMPAKVLVDGYCHVVDGNFLENGQ